MIHIKIHSLFNQNYYLENNVLESLQTILRLQDRKYE